MNANSLSDLLSNSVLHLETGVDLDEIVFPMFVHQELHCAGIFIANLNNTAKCKQTDTGYLAAKIAMNFCTYGVY